MTTVKTKVTTNVTPMLMLTSLVVEFKAALMFSAKLVLISNHLPSPLLEKVG